MARRYNDFDDPDQDGVFDQILSIVARRKRAFALISVAAAVILLALVVWGSYPDADSGSSESVPIVRADAGAYKTTPDNPGGMEIPYRDSTVFSSLGGAARDSGTENILAGGTSEEPVPRSQLFAGLNTDAPEAVAGTRTESLVQEAIGGGSETETASATASASAPVTEVAPVTEDPAPRVAAVTPPKAEPVKAEPEARAVSRAEPAAGAAATTAARAVTPGQHYVQLASVRSLAGVDGEWKKLQAKYSALSGLKYRTQEANLGERGVFHRVQAGPMSKESADAICAEIKKTTPGGCLVTR